jgi:hypothetical protein
MSIFVGVPWLIIMALEQEFENALKDVVSSKRASVSKMTRLSEAAKRCFEVCFASSTAIPK